MSSSAGIGDINSNSTKGESEKEKAFLSEAAEAGETEHAARPREGEKAAAGPASFVLAYANYLEKGGFTRGRRKSGRHIWRWKCSGAFLSAPARTSSGGCGRDDERSGRARAGRRLLAAVRGHHQSRFLLLPPLSLHRLERLARR